MTDKNDVVESLVGLYFDFACRALMGGGKGMYILAQVHEDSVEAYQKLINAAEQHLVRIEGMQPDIVAKHKRNLADYIRDLERERSN